jgi:hypothetical protein
VTHFSYIVAFAFFRNYKVIEYVDIRSNNFHEIEGFGNDNLKMILLLEEPLSRLTSTSFGSFAALTVSIKMKKSTS